MAVGETIKGETRLSNGALNNGMKLHKELKSYGSQSEHLGRPLARYCTWTLSEECVNVGEDWAAMIVDQINQRRDRGLDLQRTHIRSDRTAGMACYFVI